MRVRRLDRAGLPLVPGARQPRLARRGPRGRAVARRDVGVVGRRPHLDLHAEARRDVHRRQPADRRGRRLQLRLLGRRAATAPPSSGSAATTSPPRRSTTSPSRSTCRSPTRAWPTTSRRATSASSRRRRSRPAPRRRTALRRSAPARSSCEEWNRGQNIVLERNDDYTSPPANALHTGPAYVEEIDWKFVADPTTRVAALQSDEVNAIYDVPAVQWADARHGGLPAREVRDPGPPAAAVVQHAGRSVHRREGAAGVRLQPRPRSRSSRPSARASSRSRATAA